MNLHNHVLLIGNLGGDPELKSFENGTKVLNVSMATNESYKDSKGERQTKTDWHRLVIFGKQAELIAEHCKSGSKLAIEGKLQTRSYEQDKTKRYITEVVVQEFIFLDTKKS
ncbi:MAG: single-stranded DNA-binding protein [Bacteroidota bacterium]|nr:single-stranded DNA-binding protein [Bacteroidota bacterium]